MIRRGSISRAVLTGLAITLAITPMSVASAAKKPIATSNENANTITVSLPGPLNGCGYLDAGSNPTSKAVLDLIQPSAFLTSTSDVLFGEGGPIAAAELTSLAPETVVYTIDSSYTWSNGVAFSGKDLLNWWLYAKTVPSVFTDGYRAIKSVVVNKDGATVTVVFSTPYSAWNTLFRDVTPAPIVPDCSFSALLRRPTLGAYNVSFASASQIVLTMNKKWKLNPNRYGRIIINASTVIPVAKNVNFARYTTQVSKSLSMTLSAHPEFASHIGTSDDLLELTFAPRTFVTSDINVRQALALSIQRQLILNSLWGSVTFSPAPATSMLLAQGQSGYPGGSGPGPTQSSTTTSVVNSETTSTTPTSTGNTVGDCLACAISLLTKDAGFKIVGGIYRNATNKALVVHMAVGPSNLERITANLIAAQWRNIGIVVYEYLFSDNASAQDAVARNRYDVGILTRTASTTPSVLARSFYGESFTDSYSSGVRTALLNKQFNSAISNFNPVNALVTWKAFDQTVLSQFWVRPIVTLPTMTIWSNSLSNAFGSLSVQGFVDQIPLWGTVVTTPSK